MAKLSLFLVATMVLVRVFHKTVKAAKSGMKRFNDTSKNLGSSELANILVETYF